MRTAKSRSKSYPQSRREQFFFHLKRHYPNFYAIYLMVSIVCIWSGCWYLGDTWAQGKDLMAPLVAVTPWVAVRHFFLLGMGLLILYVDDQSLQELVFMKAIPVLRTRRSNPLKRFFDDLKSHHPNWVIIFSYIGIILSWCGTWGLLWDIPIQPFWRSLMTITIGFGLLYIDGFGLTEIQEIK